ncbi:MAG: TolC family protein [Nannocystaceae bacterium]
MTSRRLMKCLLRHVVSDMSKTTCPEGQDACPQDSDDARARPREGERAPPPSGRDQGRGALALAAPRGRPAPSFAPLLCARELGLLLGIALAPGCLHEPAYAPERALAVWRSQAAAVEVDPGTSPDAPTPAVGDPLGPAEVYALAEGRSPELAAIAAREAVANAEIRASRAVDDPQLRLTNVRLDDAVNGPPELSLGVRVPIPRPWALQARVDAAEQAAVAQARWTDETRFALRAEVDRLFARLDHRRADLEQALRSLAIRRSEADHLGARVERAVATRLDAAMAEVRVAEVDDEVHRLRGEITGLERALARLAGVAPGRLRIDPRALEAAPLDLDPEGLTELALRSRPELQGAQARSFQGAAEVRALRGEAWPWLDWTQLAVRTGGASGQSSLGFGVAVGLPIFGRTQARVRVARARQRQRELEEAASIAAVVDEVAAAIEAARTTASRVRALEEGLLPRVEVALREAEAALAAGALDPLEADAALAREVAARRVHLAALLDHREAVIDLEVAVGAPLGGGR